MFFNILLTIFFACQPANNKPSSIVDPDQNGQEDTTITMDLLFVGDVMGHTPQITSAYNATTKTHDYDECFKYIKPIVSKADLAVANLEVTLPGGPPYKGYPMFRSPDVLATALKNAGFDMLVTSNNHSNDSGLKGVVNTLDVLDKNNLLHTGTFRNEDEKSKTYPHIYKHKVGDKFIKLAFLNYTYDTNGLPTIAPSIVNLIDRDQIKKDIQLAKTYSPDMIICVMHWGLEYQLKESPEQRELTEMIWQNGVDLVIGAHPHVVQPVKKSKVAGRDVRVTYSLGNFISNQQQANTDVGLLYQVQIVKDVRNGKTTLGKDSWMPVWRWIKNAGVKGAKTTYYAVPADDLEQNVHNLPAADFAKMKTNCGKIVKHLRENE